jgi:hypothetical protein
MPVATPYGPSGAAATTAMSPDPTVRGSSVNAMPAPQQKGMGAYVAVGASVGLLAVGVIAGTAYWLSRTPTTASNAHDTNALTVPVAAQGSTATTSTQTQVAPQPPAAQQSATSAASTASSQPSATPQSTATQTSTPGPKATASAKKTPIKVPQNPF